MLKGWAIVDLRRGTHIVASLSDARGALIANGWVEVAPASATDAELGALVRAAMAESRTGVPFPNLRNGPLPAVVRMQQLAGVSSYSRYVKGVRQVAVAAAPDAPAVSVFP
jgi:hypothetical protein